MATSSGGHQPWRVVTLVFSVERALFVSLDESCVGVVSQAGVSFPRSGSMEVKLWKSVQDNLARIAVLELRVLFEICKGVR